MVGADPLIFGPFRLEQHTNTLWQDDQPVLLRPRPLAVLRYLAQHPGRLVTTEELLQAVWAGTIVSKTTLQVCIRRVREALNEDSAAPQYIETVGREGYRFIGPLQTSPSEQWPAQDGAEAPTSMSSFVGRQAELAALQQCVITAQAGTRQLVFVTGEAGIGKTTLLDQFVDQLQASGPVWLGHGQCLEQYGAGEAYLPVLEAIGRLGRAPSGERVVTVLRQYAPTWLQQLSALRVVPEGEDLPLPPQGMTQERMLREMAEALEILTQDYPLILILEDLHWSDVATLELLAYVAQRREPAQLVVMGTYRPTDVIISAHPLRAITQELQARHCCQEIALDLLTLSEITEYVADRFDEDALVTPLAEMIHRRTEGNALFMINVVEQLLTQGLDTAEAAPEEWQAGLADLTDLTDLTDLADTIPDSLHLLITKQLERLSPEQQHVLEAASVVGATFAVAAVAAGLTQEEEVIEAECEALARQGTFVEALSLAEWPDGTLSGRYGFRHALYQNVLYERIAPARQVRLHRRIGERAASGYAERVAEIAAELAVHFEAGRDYPQAVTYWQQAAQTALQRYAYQEAVDNLHKALNVLESLPDTPERAKQELGLQTTLGSALTALNGTAASEVERAYTRARALCQHVEDTTQLFTVLWGLFVSSIMRGRLVISRELAEQLMQLAQPGHDPTFLHQAHYALGMTLYRQGEFLSAREHLEQSLARSPHQPRPYQLAHGASDPEIGPLSFLAWTLWQLGYPDQALAKSQQALGLAQAGAHPVSWTFALSFLAWLHKLRREPSQTHARAEEALALATTHELAQMKALSTILRGWAQDAENLAEERSGQIAQGIDAWQATGAKDGRPYYLALLAESYSKTGQMKEGLALLGEALGAIHENGERYYEAELYRLKGELQLAQEGKNQQPKINTQEPVLSPFRGAKMPNSDTEAEACFEQALEIARRQSAKSFELRAAMSLGRLWQQQGKKKEARQLLMDVYDWFTEGFDTPDLQDAKALLEALA